MPDVYLRAARAEDQGTIRRMIRAAGLYPLSLDWPRFVVAESMGESRGEIVGIGQVKRLRDGAPELASLAVLPPYQGSGVGGVLVWTLISRTPGPLYLRCASHNESYYQRFGFVTLAPEQMPASLRRIYCLTDPVVRLYNRLTGDSERMLVMGRP
jgi:N-acetylglutamate synthase-like GNAT family acetyltransferase